MQPARRRLSLLDLVVLVASAALGLTALRWLYPDVRWSEIPGGVMREVGRRGPILGIAGRAAEQGMTLLPAVSIPGVAIVVLRLRHPRPKRWRRVWSQPGILACLVIALIELVAVMVPKVVYWIFSLSGHRPGAHVYLEWWEVLPGVGVIASWTTLALTGRWRPERSWLDRIGRALDTFAALTVLLLWFYLLLE